MRRGGTSEKEDGRRVVAYNRKARFEYFIEEVFEVGVVLTGTEVKSLRQGKASIGDAFADVRGDELFLINAHIQEYTQGNRFNHSPIRPRKLLMHRREINKLAGKVKQKGQTLVPLSVYFNRRNIAKVELALVKGKQAHDKRQAIKDRDWKREKSRMMKK